MLAARFDCHEALRSLRRMQPLARRQGLCRINRVFGGSPGVYQRHDLDYSAALGTMRLTAWLEPNN
jgi:hypothetical protein